MDFKVKPKAPATVSGDAADTLATKGYVDGAIPSYSVATAAKDGLMSSGNWTKLNGIADNANNYAHPTTAGNKHIPSGGSSGQLLGYSSSGTAKWVNAPSAGGKRFATIVVGTSAAGYTADDVDYLCTGTNDHTTIKTAIDALPAHGGEVLLLDGSYNFTSYVYFDATNAGKPISIRGQGDGTIIQCNYTTDNYTQGAFVFSYNGEFDISFNKLKFNGAQRMITTNLANVTGFLDIQKVTFVTTGDPIVLSSSDALVITIYGCNFFNVGRIRLTSNSIFDNCYCFGDKHSIYRTNGKVINSTFVSGVEGSTNTAISLGEGGLAVNNTIVGFNLGIHVRMYNSQFVTNNKLINNKNGIGLEGTKAAMIAGNLIKRDGGYSGSEFSIATTYSASDSSKCMVVNNIIGKAVTTGGTGHVIVDNLVT